MHVTSIDMEIMNRQGAAPNVHTTATGWLFVEFFVPKRSVQPRVRAFWLIPADTMGLV